MEDNSKNIFKKILRETKHLWKEYLFTSYKGYTIETFFNFKVVHAIMPKYLKSVHLALSLLDPPMRNMVNNH